MASTRKSRSVNKRYPKFEEDYTDNVAPNINKNKTRKRKISDMLGPQWSKEELERFYEAFRTHGKEWRKVAGALRLRSTEMVESLYNMNKAYLSLPEGTATAAGLIAMMTDHYNIMEGSDSERESNDGPRTSRKPHKRARGKYRSMSKGSDGPFPDLLQSHPASSSYGCLSFLKRKHSGGSMPRVVGKRTPRIHVSNTSKSEPGDEGAHVAALTLAEASQQVSSPQASKTPGRRGENLRCKEGDSEIADSRTAGLMDNDYPEGSLGSREAENGDFNKDCASTYETRRKGKKVPGRKPISAVNEKNHSDDDREACSGTEEGSSKKMKDVFDNGMTDGKISRSSKGPRKGSNQLFTNNESTDFDALHALADLSFHILPSTAESESSIQAKGDKRIFNYNENLNVHESTSTNHFGDRPKVSDNIDRAHSTVAEGDHIRKGIRSTKGIALDTQTSLEINTNKVNKRQRKVPLKLKDDFDATSLGIDGLKAEVPMEEGKRMINKPRRFIQTSPPRKGKSIKQQELMSTSPDLGKSVKDVKEPIFQLPTSEQNNLPRSSRNRRKMNLKKAFSGVDLKHTESLVDSRVNTEMFDSKERLYHCLSSRNLRRWCLFEWFYSAIDLPWFAKTEFVEYLNHVKLGHVPRLTRVEWGVIRSSLGKPRRLSQKFLKEEREKLEQYRESVRTHYAELRAGTKEGLPTDLARPLSVGQRVSACHPKSREMHDGSILTVDHNRCRVQFDRPELGVEFIMDTDCMPLNPLENMPEALRKQYLGSFRCYNTFLDIKLEPKDWTSNFCKNYTPNDSSGAADVSSYLASPDYPLNILMTQANGSSIDAIMQAKAVVNEVVAAAQQAIHNQPGSLAQLQAREADTLALAELARALDKKEALLIEVKYMNEEMSRNEKDSSGLISDMDNFKKQYVAVLGQLRDANDQVASSLINVRDRNTYPGSSASPWPTPVENYNGTAINQACFSSASQDSGSGVVEVVEGSKQVAMPIVEVAVQVSSSLKDGDDAFAKLGEALELTNKESTLRSLPYDFANENSTKQSMPDDGKEIPYPSQLITQCVATLFMIRSCAETQQYPPGEVAQVMETALANLQPRSSKTLLLYREIETCMGILKNQILALIPTPASSETSIA